MQFKGERTYPLTWVQPMMVSKSRQQEPEAVGLNQETERRTQAVAQLHLNSRGSQPGKGHHPQRVHLPTSVNTMSPNHAWRPISQVTLDVAKLTIYMTTAIEVYTQTSEIGNHRGSREHSLAAGGKTRDHSLSLFPACSILNRVNVLFFKT